MDTKALRQKILDLAIRGQLVPQDPNDEPASVLLDRIRAEKQKMVKEGKLKAKDIKNDSVIFVGEDNLHYEKFADGSVKCIENEIPFDLPERWEWVRLQSICSMSNGVAKRNGSDGTGTIVLRLADLGEREISFSDTRSVILTDDEIRKYALFVGDVLFIRVNGSKENVGKSFYFDNESFPVAYCDHLIRCTPTGVLRGKLLSMFMRCGYVRQLIDERMVSAAGQNTISQPSLATILLPVPPLKEQDRISHGLNNADNYISQIYNSKQRLADLVLHTKAKILDLAIRGQLVPQDPNDEPASILLERIRAEKEALIKQGKLKRYKKESIIFRGEDNSYYEKVGGEVICIDNMIPFEIPESWAWCRGYSCFEDMASIKPHGDFFDYIDIDAIDNRSHCIKEAKHLPVAKAPSRASRALQSGSVLFSLVRPYLENIALVDEEHSHCIASTGFYVCNSNGVFLPEFLFFLMISRYVVSGLNQYMKGDNSPSISKDNIEDWLYPIPPLEEQEAICFKLKEAFSAIGHIEKSLS